LQLLTLGAAEICLCSRISFFPISISRGESNFADDLSHRFQDGCDDWQLHPDWFRYLDAVCGPHTVDRFANDLNA
jgi:hypothetical protein